MTTRDQQRALHAYASARVVPKPDREDYRIAVNGFGADSLRSGLAVAMAALERQRGRRGTTLFLDHLAAAGVPIRTGADGANRSGGSRHGESRSVTGAGLPDAVRALSLDDYMLASREFLRVAAWFRRAMAATFGEEQD